jgi:hypothetical protein
MDSGRKESYQVHWMKRISVGAITISKEHLHTDVAFAAAHLTYIFYQPKEAANSCRCRPRRAIFYTAYDDNLHSGIK